MVTVTRENTQDIDELRVFRLFVEAAGLPVSLDSVQKREPPEPDIQCDFKGYGSTRFELVEIVDRGLARSVSSQITFQGRLLKEAEQCGLGGFSDGLIYVRFSDTAGSAKRSKGSRACLGFLPHFPTDSKETSL